MNKIWVISRKDISEAFRSRTTYVFIVMMAVVTFVSLRNYDKQVAALTGENLIAFSRVFLTGLAFILPVMYSILVCSIFANYSVIVDKAKRNLESLMATPVTINQIWMGKSLAVTLPSLAIGLGISILDYIIINYTTVMPRTHAFVFPDALAIITALFIVPFLIFAIVSIVINIQLIITNPRIANFVFTGIFVLLIFSITTVGGTGVSTSVFPLLYLGIIVLCAAISYVLSRFLTKEKVLLSSKM